jgi:catechol 2,3-dioxygenase-like lactoylglutathione lyase family enzyme
MRIRGLSHITIIVQDLDRTARMLCRGLGALEIYDSHDKPYSIAREKFFDVGGVWLVAMEGRPKNRDYRHIAFSVAAEDLPRFASRLEGLGVEIKPPRPRVPAEGQSLYFYDHDNNLFELHAGSLEGRLALYRR